MLGKVLFERVWVSAPASTVSSDGLGPFYNAASCDTCHPGGGGGYLAPGATEIPAALVLHFLADQQGFSLGRQWQPFATQGLNAELSTVSLSWQTDYLQYASGEQVARHRPHFILDVGENVTERQVVVSPRLAPDLHGVAALSGLNNGLPLGLQGAVQTLEEQVALALAMDMGLGNPHFPDPEGDCTRVQHVCIQVAVDGQTGPSPEFGSDLLQLLVAYLEALGPPQKRNSAEISKDSTGYSVFSQLGCDTCHIQEQQTDLQSWSDFSLHDMGEGLADRNLAGETVVTYWRTAPLWGLSQKLASGSVSLLHDGRAATIEQAILWHEGEALNQRNRFLALTQEQRTALLDFLSRL